MEEFRQKSFIDPHLVTDLGVGTIGAAVTGHTGKTLGETPIAISTLITQLSQNIVIGTAAGSKQRAAVTQCTIGMTLTGCRGNGQNSHSVWIKAQVLLDTQYKDKNTGSVNVISH